MNSREKSMSADEKRQLVEDLESQLEDWDSPLECEEDCVAFEQEMDAMASGLLRLFGGTASYKNTPTLRDVLLKLCSSPPSGWECVDVESLRVAAEGIENLVDYMVALEYDEGELEFDQHAANLAEVEKIELKEALSALFNNLAIRE